MIYLNTILYYVCFSATTLFYGIGTNKVIDFDTKYLKNTNFVLKIIISIALSAAISWLVVTNILIPLNMQELSPLVIFLIYICINTFMEALIRLTTGKSTSEFIFSYLTILLSISESSSLVNMLLICSSCILSFLILIPLTKAFRKRNNDNENEKYYCRYFLFLAVIMLSVSVYDIVWFNQGA